MCDARIRKQPFSHKHLLFNSDVERNFHTDNGFNCFWHKTKGLILSIAADLLSSSKGGGMPIVRSYESLVKKKLNEVAHELIEVQYVVLSTDNVYSSIIAAVLRFGSKRYRH